MKNIILITGASSGIGKEFAAQMDLIFPSIDEFWLVARSKEGLEKTASILSHKSRIFPMDITDHDALDLLEVTMLQEDAVLRILVNAAGYGLMGRFAKQEREEELGMIRLNCEALTEITYRMLPFMRKNSRIIQMASCAAFLPQPNFAVYAASKAYVLSFSRALAEEVRERGIYVTSVCPGPVNTRFFDRAEKNGTTLSIKKLTMVTADKMVSLAIRDSFVKKGISIYSLPIKAVRGISKILPQGAIVRIMGVLSKEE